MANLTNGLKTIELNDTNYRQILNDNFSKFKIGEKGENNIENNAIQTYSISLSNLKETSTTSYMYSITIGYNTKQASNYSIVISNDTNLSTSTISAVVIGNKISYLNNYIINIGSFINKATGSSNSDITKIGNNSYIGGTNDYFTGIGNNLFCSININSYIKYYSLLIGTNNRNNASLYDVKFTPYSSNFFINNTYINYFNKKTSSSFSSSASYKDINFNNNTYFFIKNKDVCYLEGQLVLNYNKINQEIYEFKCVLTCFNNVMNIKFFSKERKVNDTYFDGVDFRVISVDKNRMKFQILTNVYISTCNLFLTNLNMINE